MRKRIEQVIRHTRIGDVVVYAEDLEAGDWAIGVELLNAPNEDEECISVARMRTDAFGAGREFERSVQTWLMQVTR